MLFFRFVSDLLYVRYFLFRPVRKAWHRRWEVLVRNAHVSIFKIITEIQKEQNRVKLEIESILRGLPRNLQKKRTESVNHEYKSYIMIEIIGQF